MLGVPLALYRSTGIQPQSSSILLILGVVIVCGCCLSAVVLSAVDGVAGLEVIYWLVPFLSQVFVLLVAAVTAFAYLKLVPERLAADWAQDRHMTCCSDNKVRL